VLGDPNARIVTLVRRSKKTTCGRCGREHSGWYDRKLRRARDLPTGGFRIFLEFEVRRVLCRQCGKVKRERLEFSRGQPALPALTRPPEATAIIFALVASDALNVIDVPFGITKPSAVVGVVPSCVMRRLSPSACTTA
jgi:transposase